ncbi:cytochrome P450 2F2-like [Protobothrops mucrosquamatus]|uniref:cytochrome P450 2F2-like n=1 Tax=Protobothrops mucrosquamatus TaxID=103944 RepID=UPI000775C64F|nr:cytochrome P450 2F2-like [Protobothrops mucrosquamatus]
MQLELIPGTIILFILFLLIFWAFRFQQERVRFPLGPPPWFLLGNLLQKDVLPLYKNYQKLIKKYGPVFTIWLGPKPLVVVCGYDAVKDALVIHSEEFGGRSPIPIFDQITGGYGLIGEDERWKVLRRFTLSTLKNFGMGKKSMAERMSEEGLYLVEKISSFEEKPFDVVPTISAAVSNVMCAVVFGKRFSYDDKILNEILEILKKFISFFLSPPGMMYSTMPNVMKFLPGPHKRTVFDCNKICDYIRTRVDSHKKTLDPDNPRDFIDCFLLKLEKEQNSKIICMEDLVMTVFQLLIAGTDSTANTIAYGIILLARFPEVQAKIQEEIDEVVGQNRQPSMEDKIKLPYTNAFAHEILRFQPGSSENFPRTTTQNMIFKGHFIPQGTTVLPLWASVHFDPLCWENPNTFDPSHFLDKNGEFQKKDAYLPFSAGKRACPGESLANMEIFISFTNLLQKFTFELTVDPKEGDLDNLFMDCRDDGKHRYIRAIKRTSRHSKASSRQSQASRASRAESIAARLAEARINTAMAGVAVQAAVEDQQHKEDLAKAQANYEISQRQQKAKEAAQIEAILQRELDNTTSMNRLEGLSRESPHSRVQAYVDNQCTFQHEQLNAGAEEFRPNQQGSSPVTWQTTLSRQYAQGGYQPAMAHATAPISVAPPPPGYNPHMAAMHFPMCCSRRVDLAAKGVQKFTDKPGKDYLMWKHVFKRAIELEGVGPEEELIQLTAWLGPKSILTAKNIYSAHLGDPEVNLLGDVRSKVMVNMWERADPQLITGIFKGKKGK